MSMPLRLLPFLLLSLVLVLAGCEDGRDPVTGDADRILYFENTTEPATLDPHKATLVAEVRIVTSLFEGLTAVDATGRIIPGQAQSWVISPGGLTYTFYLRDDLHWSDGSAVTAADFVAGLRRAVDPATGSGLAANLSPLHNADAILAGEADPATLGVEAVDERTVRIRLVKPKPSLIELLSDPVSYPVPRALVASKGDAWTAPGTLVSNGAFVLEAWDGDGAVTLARNERYHAAAQVALDGAVFMATGDTQHMAIRMAEGRLHIQPDIPLNEAVGVDSDVAKSLHVVPIHGVYFYVFNNQHPVLKNAAVRRALSMAVDREQLVQTIMQGIGYVPAYGLVPRTLATWVPPDAQDWEALTAAERRDRARLLLEEAGITPETPLALALSFNVGADHRRVALAIAAMWQPLGIKVTLESSDLRDHTLAIRRGNFDVARLGWSGPYDAPEYYLGLLMSNAGILNFPHYRNPEFDIRMEQALALSGVDARVAAFREAEYIAMADQPILPIFNLVSMTLVAPQVTGFEDNPADIHRLRYLDIGD